MSKKGKPTADERLAAGLKKLDNSAKWLAKRHDSAGQYIKKAKTAYRAYYQKYGEADITKIDGDMMEELLTEKYSNAYTLKNMIHALHYVQEAVVESRTFREPLDLVNKKKALDFCKEYGILRKASDSTVLKANREQVFMVAKETKNSCSPIANQAEKAIMLAWACTARAEGVIETKGEDIVFNHDGSATVHLHEKGGLHRWTRVYDLTKVDYLRQVKNQLKNDRQTILEPIRYDRGDKKGQIMKTEDAEKRLGKVIQKAAQRVGLSNPTDKKCADFSLHSARKCNLSEQVDWYKQHDREKLEQIKENRIREQKQIQAALRKKGDRYKLTDMEEKYIKAVERVNWVKPPRNGKPGIRRTKVDRDLTDHELALFLTSVDAGHFRIDVLRYYLK